MTISYPLTYPGSSAYSPFSQSLGPDLAVDVTESIFTMQQTIYENTGERWILNISYRALSPQYGKDLMGFICALRGSVGTFLWGDKNTGTPSGIATGTPLVNGAGQQGAKTLNTKGWTNSITGILKRGDFFQIGNRLHIVTQDANSNGSGLSTLDIFPAVRDVLTDGQAITISNPKGLFRLLTSNQILMNTSAQDKLYDFTVVAVEAI